MFETDIDSIRLNLNNTSLLALKIIIGFIMYGISLELKISDFKNVLRSPKNFLLGLLVHLILFPAFTLGFCWLFQLRPSICMGLILISACPGGSLANLMTSLSKGNLALCISLTSISTLLSLVTTPLLLLVLSPLVPNFQSQVSSIQLNPTDVMEGVFLILGIPLTLGMLTSHYAEEFSQKMHKGIKKLSFIFLVVFVIGALIANFNHFLNVIHVIVGAVLGHNLMAIVLALIVAKVFQVQKPEAMALTFFSGVKNTALGLALVFQFYDGLGGMAIVAAFWGITQIFLGMILSKMWSLQRL